MTHDPLAMAINIASRAHAGQVDKCGHPYILHPIAVMGKMDTDELRIIAVLHDVIEDTDVTLVDLARDNIPQRALNAICALTRLPGQTWNEYLDQVETNIDAIKVKIADLQHNSDVSRDYGDGFSEMVATRYIPAITRLKIAYLLRKAEGGFVVASAAP